MHLLFAVLNVGTCDVAELAAVTSHENTLLHIHTGRQFESDLFIS